MTFSPLTKEKGVPMEEYDTPDELYMYQKYNEVCYTYNDVLSALQGLKEELENKAINNRIQWRVHRVEINTSIDKWFPILLSQPSLSKCDHTDAVEGGAQ